MSSQMCNPTDLVVPKGMLRVKWFLGMTKGRVVETVEFNDVRRIRRAQLVVPQDGVYNVTLAYHVGDVIHAHCWPIESGKDVKS